MCILNSLAVRQKLEGIKESFGTKTIATPIPVLDENALYKLLCSKEKEHDQNNDYQRS